MKRVIPLILLLTPAVAYGGGFELNEHGAAATGMVGAFTAKADDPSAIFFNPAGLAHQRGLQLYVGSTIYAGQPSASSMPGESSRDANLLLKALPTIYASYGLPHDVALGIGAFTNYGLSVEWPGDWQGRFLATKASLTSVTINPTVSWRPVEWLAVGAGVDVTPASAELARSVDLMAGEAQVNFKGDDTAVGANAGILLTTPGSWTARPISLGVSYRSRYDFSFGDGALTVAAPPELAGMLHDAKASAVLPIPDALSIGIGAQATDRVFLQAQLDWANWSRFQNLTLNVPSSPIMTTTIPERWNDGYVARGGIEYAYDKTKLRFGFGYDWNPVPDATLNPFLPDADRWLISGGASVDMSSGIVAELGVMGVLFRSRFSDLPEFPVQYSNYAVLTSLSLSYRQH
jgi:long-chain fatty acid transport protein